MPKLTTFFCGLLFLLAVEVNASGVEPFADQVAPFLKTYCVGCHNKDKSEAELDLSRFTSAAMMAEHFRQWENVVTFLKKEEMPPAKAKQPSATERATILATIEELLQTQAKKLAGDPGVVLPRRLSNAEYNYSIRDLTGVDIRPADSFPVDPASGEGFSNTGEALVMSPSLFKKYYAAAQHVADHVVFKPTGFEFAPFPVVSFADKKEFHERAILHFYEQHDVKYETYLTSLWLFRYRPAAQHRTAIETWATTQNLSPRYSRLLWDTLQGTPADDKFYLNWLRERWNALPPPENAANPMVSATVANQIRTLAADIRRLSNTLCAQETPAIVGNAGNAPVLHIDRRKKTAAERDTFNAKLMTDSRRLHLELKGILSKPSTQFFIYTPQVGDEASKEYVLLKDLNLSTVPPANYNPADKKTISMRTLLEKHAPDQLKKLKFGIHPLGESIDPDKMALAPNEFLEIALPEKAFLDVPGVQFYAKTPMAVPGIHLYAEASLDRKHGNKGAAVIKMSDQSPKKIETGEFDFPLVDANNPSAEQLKASCVAFCATFPNRFFYVDDTRGLSAGFHLIEGFFRDDIPLCKKVLDDEQNKTLNRLWNELEFGTQIMEKMLRGFVFFERSERNFIKHADFDSIKEEDPELVKEENLRRFEELYLKRSNVTATGEDLEKHPIHVFFEEIRQGLKNREAQLAGAESIYLKELLAFAERAYRRPLTSQEAQRIEEFYKKTCRQPEFGVEQAVRGVVVSILVSPHFCYHADVPPASGSVKPLPDNGLASRLSYFLWSSVPDSELVAFANAGKLNNEESIRSQTRRMLKDPKVSAFALEFFGQWLRYRDFLKQESVDRKSFPVFDDGLKQAMYEEPTRLATYLIQNNLPITDLLYGDTTFVNKSLARHYNVNYTGRDGEWEKVTGMQQQGRGGLLGMAVFLTEYSQPQRTSPVKRGFWVVHKILGEHIPAPPADVAVLPAKETDTNGKTIRELLVLHTEDARCARCHQRFDPIGLAMEGFDPIGRNRTKDLAGRSIDNVVKLPNGKEARGVPEFLKYLEAQRNDEFIRTFCRKFLGYALGRSVELSDQSLLERMQAELKTNEYRFGTLFDVVVMSPQFRNQRCRDFSAAQFKSEP